MKFSSAARLFIHRQLDSVRKAYGRTKPAWLASQIAAQLPPGSISNRESFRKAVHRFMEDPESGKDRFVETIAPFAHSISDQGAAPLETQPSSPLGMYKKGQSSRGAYPSDNSAQMRVELAINDRAEAIIFYSQPFSHDLSWLEFDPDTNRLSFIMQEGVIRNFGIAVQPKLIHYIQNAFQVLMVLMDANGEPVEGGYIPLMVKGKNPTIIKDTHIAEEIPPSRRGLQEPFFSEGHWVHLAGPKLTQVIRQLSDAGISYSLSGSTSRVSIRNLPFYRNYTLLRVRDRTWKKRTLSLYFLTSSDVLYRLMGQSPPIHEVNGKAPIQVTADNVLDYLRFFCYFVRGEEGPFLIVEGIDNPNLPKHLEKRVSVLLQQKCRPAVLIGQNDRGYFLCEAVIFYGSNLFIAHFEVQPSGMIKMLDDDPIADNLPVKVDLPIT